MKFTEALKVGIEAPFPIYRHSRWDRHDPPGETAWKLWHYLRDLRQIGRAALHEPSWKLDEITRRAAELDEFSLESWQAW